MKKEFVPYNVAKRLKDLGFDEKCFGYYGIDYGTGYEFVSEIYRNSSENLVNGWQTQQWGTKK